MLSYLFMTWMQLRLVWKLNRCYLMIPTRIRDQPFSVRFCVTKEARPDYNFYRAAFLVLSYPHLQQWLGYDYYKLVRAMLRTCLCQSYFLSREDFQAEYHYMLRTTKWRV